MDRRSRVSQSAELAKPGEPTDRDQLVAGGLASVAASAAFLSLSRSTLYVLMDEGTLAYVKLRRARRIPKRALVDLAARNLHGGGNGGGAQLLRHSCEPILRPSSNSPARRATRSAPCSRTARSRAPGREALDDLIDRHRRPSGIADPRFRSWSARV